MCSKPHSGPKKRSRALYLGTYIWYYSSNIIIICTYYFLASCVKVIYTHTHTLRSRSIRSICDRPRWVYIQSYNMGIYIMYTLWTSRDNLVLITPRVPGRTESGISMTSRTPIHNTTVYIILHYCIGTYDGGPACVCCGKSKLLSLHRIVSSTYVEYVILYLYNGYTV